MQWILGKYTGGRGYKITRVYDLKIMFYVISSVYVSLYELNLNAR